MTTLYTHIAFLLNVREKCMQLRGKDLAILPMIENAFLLVEDARILCYGTMSEMNDLLPHLPVQITNLSGRIVMPTWVDSHTHLVFAGSREGEFIDKINGLSYAEIAAKGGGILNSARLLQSVSEDILFSEAMKRLEELKAIGTGAIEIKSGYGLTVEAELKMLRVIKKIKAAAGIPVKATFLGAHTYPEFYNENHEGYLREIEEQMLPIIAEEKLADFIDVFCENGFFSPEETARICKAGKKIGLIPKLHVNQLHSIGGIDTGVRENALSLDHLETLTAQDIKILGQYSGHATLLPSAAFFLRMPYQPARALIDAGAAVTLASDYNPGSSPSGNMNFVAALSCIQMKMFPEEVINAGTINGAFAMQVEDQVGSVTVGKRANLIITKQVPSVAYLMYSFGSNLIEQVLINGEPV